VAARGVAIGVGGPEGASELEVVLAVGWRSGTASAGRSWWMRTIARPYSADGTAYAVSGDDSNSASERV